jgi:hypothetical protein
MRLPFEEYHPQIPPERMLAAIRREAVRRRRRRRLAAGGLALVAVVGVGIVVLTGRPAPPLPPTATPPALAIQSLEHGGNPVPYTLVTLSGGQVCVVVRTADP